MEAGRPNWWTRLIERLPAKRSLSVWLKGISLQSDYRSPDDQRHAYNNYHYGTSYPYDFDKPDVVFPVAKMGDGVEEFMVGYDASIEPPDED